MIERSNVAVVVAVTLALVAGAPRMGTAQSGDTRADLTFSLGGYRLNLRPGNYLGYKCDPPPNCFNVPGRPEPYTWNSQVSAGFYSNKRLKTEVAFAWTSSAPDGTRSDVYDRETVVTPSETKWVYLLHNYDIHRTSISQLVRLRAGKRWQPYVGVTLAVDRETFSDSREESVSAPLSDAERQRWIRERVRFSTTDTLPASFPAPVTTTYVHAFARAGFKAYMGKRVSFLLEMERGSKVAPLRVGIGLDLY